MKKAYRLCTLLLAISFLIGGVSLAQASEPYHSKTISELNGTLYVDNKKLEDSFNVIFENDFTLVPLRKIFESLGFEVNWIPETGIHELYSDDYEFVFRTSKRSSSPYMIPYTNININESIYFEADDLYFQQKAYSDINDPSEGWVHFELDSVDDYYLFRSWYGRDATTMDMEAFHPSPAVCCLIDNRYYMSVSDMKTLLEQICYTLVIDKDNNSVRINRQIVD